VVRIHTPQATIGSLHGSAISPAARMQHLLILLVGLIISGAVAANAIVQALKKRAKTSR